MEQDSQKSNTGGPKAGNAIERSQTDIAAGRPDLARDRLTGYLYTLHRQGAYRQEAYALLGAVHFEMRDYARAGAAWLLTEKKDAESQKAFDAFYARYGNDSVNILKIVKPHAPSEDYPPAVQERLKSWNYRYRPYRPRSNPHALDELAEKEQVSGVRPVELGCALAVLVFAIIFLYWVWMNIRLARGV